jgi:hypothetical protein
LNDELNLLDLLYQLVYILALSFTLPAHASDQLYPLEHTLVFWQYFCVALEEFLLFATLLAPCSQLFIGKDEGLGTFILAEEDNDSISEFMSIHGLIRFFYTCMLEKMQSFNVMTIQQ